MKKNEKTNQINKKSKTEQTNMSHGKQRQVLVRRGIQLNFNKLSAEIIAKINEAQVKISNLNCNISTHQTNLLISLLLWKI